MTIELAGVSELSALLQTMREHGVASLKSGNLEIVMGPVAPAAEMKIPIVDPLALVTAANTTSTAGPLQATTVMSKSGLEARRKAYESLGLVPVNEMTPAAIALASAGTYDPATDEPKDPGTPAIPTHVEDEEK